MYGNQNQLLDLNFNGCSAFKYINIRAGSQYNTIERCNFQNKPISSDAGNLIEVQADKTVPGYNIIRYCSFQHMPGKGGDNGNEPIRIGEGEVSFSFLVSLAHRLLCILPHSFSFTHPLSSLMYVRRCHGKFFITYGGRI